MINLMTQESSLLGHYSTHRLTQSLRFTKVKPVLFANCFAVIYCSLFRNWISQTPRYLKLRAVSLRYSYIQFSFSSTIQDLPDQVNSIKT